MSSGREEILFRHLRRENKYKNGNIRQHCRVGDGGGGERSPPPTDQLMTVSTSTTRSRPGATDYAVQTLLDNSPYQPLLDKITYMSYVL